MSKTGKGLAKWAEDIYKADTHVYWWGTYCKPCSDTLLAGKTKQYPEQYKESRQGTYRNHIVQGKIATDCCGLIKGYYWEKDGVIKYKRNDLPDRSASGLYSSATVKGTIDTLPDIPGVLLFTKSRDHVAVYVGGGYEVEARGFNQDIQRHKVSERSFTHWGLCAYIEYTTDEVAKAKAAVNGENTSAIVSGTGSTVANTGTENTAVNAVQEGKTVTITLNTLRNGSKGKQVKTLQRLLIIETYDLGSYGADGSFGAMTEKAVKAFQKKNGLEVDGIVGKNTWTALLK